MNERHVTIAIFAFSFIVTDDDATLSCKDAKRASLEGSAPQIYMWTDSRLERAGASAQLFCRARGDPTPNISWSNEGGDILKNGDRFTVSRNETEC